MSDLLEIWERTKDNGVLQPAVVKYLISDCDTPFWNSEDWYPLTVLFGPSLIAADLDVQRYDGNFIIYPTFMGEVLMDLDPMLVPVAEVEQS